MAVVDCTKGGTVGVADNPNDVVYAVLKNTITIADYTWTGATDTMQALDLPAGFMMSGGWIDVDTASTGTGDIDSVGYYGGTADAWHAGDIDLATAGRTVFAGTYGAYAYGVNHATADTLDLLFKTGTPTDGVITVVAYGFYSAQPA